MPRGCLSPGVLPSFNVHPVAEDNICPSIGKPLSGRGPAALCEKSRKPTQSSKLAVPNAPLPCSEALLNPSGFPFGKNKRRVELARMISSLLGDHVYTHELLEIILCKGTATMDVQLGFPDDKAHIHGDLSSGYEETGYACMDQDRWRNAYFEAAIAEASAAKKASAEGLEVEEKGSMRPSCQASNNGPGPLHGHRHWLEIGPGAMGTLSRLVLEAHPDNTLTAIEAVPSSARAVVKRLQRWYGREKRRREGGWGPGGGLAGRGVEGEGGELAVAKVKEERGGVSRERMEKGPRRSEGTRRAGRSGGRQQGRTWRTAGKRGNVPVSGSCRGWQDT
ncbi:hypothetical protein Naga_100938g1 [Nannochloropsis gaditana]|uniref:Uncharacterized protein n=1 Tax=Nannochloropsis gaditana TaxID=72520 RepID=W7T9G1_9STRA|nr:hypothetical protein Naga_100938g1 [Nannochloropsis gaditana]